MTQKKKKKMQKKDFGLKWKIFSKMKIILLTNRASLILLKNLIKLKEENVNVKIQKQLINKLIKIINRKNNNPKQIKNKMIIKISKNKRNWIKIKTRNNKIIQKLKK